MPEQSEQLKRFITLLKEIFELDKSDLDFGIYRIMSLRKARIEKFLSDGLPKKVHETLQPFATDTAAAEARIKEIEALLGGSDNIPTLPQTLPLVEEYNGLKTTLAKGMDISGLEADVYSALYSFFSRYYEEGDFISKRRYKEGVYAIPYEGEEVKLYWANQDQYYIKTGENFKDYSFVSDGVAVHFRLTDATTEQNNNKEAKDAKRTFMLFAEDEKKFPGIKTFEYDPAAKELVIRFVYDIPKDKKKKYAEENCKNIEEWLESQKRPELAPLTASGKGEDSPLKKHLNAYMAKNTFDYFIHKDLRGFLTRELDFFIKNEIMHLEDLDTDNEAPVESYLAKVKAVKRVGRDIIDFLAQIEDFQKKLWLKKKFVVETNWCITLDRIDKNFWQKIKSNKKQIDEWIAMYAIDEADGWTDPPTDDFLRANRNLIVDTKNFSETFKYDLLASIPDLDAQTNGLMISGDNFQALNLMKRRYGGRIKYVYIDPPYNAQSSEILYKNNYKHASWLSMIQNRVQQSIPLLSADSVYTIAIDEVENHRLGMLTDELLGRYSGKTDVSVIINPSGQQGKNFSTTNEYLHFYYQNVPNMLGKEPRSYKNADVRGFMNGAKGEGGNYLRASGKTCFYAIYVENEEIVGFGDVCPDDYHPEANVVNGAVTEIYPVDTEGVERKWLFGRDTVESIVNELSVKRNKNSGLLEIIRTKKNINYKTCWTKETYSAKQYGTNLLTRLFGKKVFSFPKSLYAVLECIRIACNSKKDAIVLDFYAGSATTGHAVMRMNSEDGGARKYILIEMGEYFDTATKARMLKAAYAVDEKDWEKGKPVRRDNGVLQIIKYMRLESYEDALANIEFSDAGGGRLGERLGDDYLIRYMVDFESRDSLLKLKAFADPFDFRMKITEKNECRERRVDLVETFNYLIGLKVSRQSAIERYRGTPAAHPAYDGAVDLVGDPAGRFAFRQIEGTLPDGRRALVIWRTVTDDVAASDAALEAYFTTARPHADERNCDVIFVNGDSGLECLRGDGESWTVLTTECEFRKRMFEEA